jgi:hypothetical protein
LFILPAFIAKADTPHVKRIRGDASNESANAVNVIGLVTMPKLGELLCFMLGFHCPDFPSMKEFPLHLMLEVGGNHIGK